MGEVSTSGSELYAKGVAEPFKRKKEMFNGIECDVVTIPTSELFQKYMQVLNAGSFAIKLSEELSPVWDLLKDPTVGRNLQVEFEGRYSQPAKHLLY